MILPTFKKLLDKWAGNRRNSLKNRFDDVIYISKEKYKILWSQRKEGLYLVEKEESTEIRKDQRKEKTFAMGLGDM